MTPQASAPVTPRVSAMDRTAIRLGALAFLGVLLTAGSLSWVVARQQAAALQEAEARMGAVLTLNTGFTYMGEERRLGAQTATLRDEPFALFLVAEAGPTGPALDRGLSWRQCDTEAIVIDAANDAQGGACVPERHQTKIWADFAALLRR